MAKIRQSVSGYTPKRGTPVADYTRSVDVSGKTPPATRTAPRNANLFTSPSPHSSPLKDAIFAQAEQRFMKSRYGITPGMNIPSPKIEEGMEGLRETAKVAYKRLHSRGTSPVRSTVSERWDVPAMPVARTREKD